MYPQNLALKIFVYAVLLQSTHETTKSTTVTTVLFTGHYFHEIHEKSIGTRICNREYSEDYRIPRAA